MVVLVVTTYTKGDETVNDKFDRPAFVKKRTDEEKAEDPGKVFTIRLNDEELAITKRWMELLDVKSEGTALKMMAACGHLCITSRFTEAHLRLLFKKERARMVDFYPKNEKL